MCISWFLNLLDQNMIKKKKNLVYVFSFNTYDIKIISRLVISYYSQGFGVGGVACFQLESESGVGFQNCWSRSRFFKTAGVGVIFLKLLESESRVGVGFSELLESESEHLLQLPTPMFIK